MQIKDKEGNIRIELTEFKKQFDDEPIFININVLIRMDNLTAKEEIFVELSDLEELEKHLRKLNDTLNHTFYFQHIDEQFQIKFEPENNGGIEITGFLTDKLYVNTTNFSFKMPSAEIPYLIKQTQNTIIELNALK